MFSFHSFLAKNGPKKAKNGQKRAKNGQKCIWACHTFLEMAWSGRKRDQSGFWIFLLFLPKKVKKWPKNAKNVFLLEKCTLVTLYCSRNGSNIAIEMRLKKVQKKEKKSPKKVKKKSKKGPKKSKIGKKKFKSCTILGLQIVFFTWKYFHFTPFSAKRVQSGHIVPLRKWQFECK